MNVTKSDAGRFATMGSILGNLTEEKNASYGDSFFRSGEIMAILYPDGIRPEQYRDALGVIRVIDKLFRIATRKEAFGESPWKDVAGYGIVAAVADESAIPKAPRLPSFPEDMPIPYRITVDEDAEPTSKTHCPPTRIEGLNEENKYRLEHFTPGCVTPLVSYFPDFPAAFSYMQNNGLAGDKIQVYSPNEVVVVSRDFSGAQ